jgi:eukaryotic-like serine/threonine-protein kinase
VNELRWQKVEQLFHAALEREPGAREAFLNEACSGDDDLRREVESLVAAGNRKTAFMTSPAMDVAAREISRETPGALSGRRIATYQIGPLLGVGGMAEVYRGRDTDLHRDVAIKVLPGSSVLDANGQARFKREGRVLASINHQNVARIYGLVEVDDMCALVMELIEGETLSDRIVRQQPTVEEALSIAAQIAAAVEAAHSMGIIHRDLKPSNIRLTVRGEVKVLDFGIAKMLHPSPDTLEAGINTFSTQAATIIGTVAYMSPEQARGQKVGHSTDVWAWGCVLYEMLTGTRAFGGSGWTDMVAKIVSEDPDWTKLPADTPITIRLLLEDCLQKDSSRRPSNISEARRRLENNSTRSTPPAASAEFALSVRSARALFLVIQFGYLAMYCAALYHAPTMVEWDIVTLRTVIFTAMTGIALRLFLISSVALAHPEAGRKFNRLFPFLLFFDGAWAASPLLAVPSIRFGLALASAAGLAYLPFTQRTLIHRIYGRD